MTTPRELNVEEGNTVELRCHADANPKPHSVRWTNLLTGATHEAAEWRLAGVERRQAGEYRCVAQNSVDTGAASLQLSVFYGPKVMHKEAN